MLQRTFMDQPLWQWGLAGLVAIVAAVVFLTLRSFVGSRVVTWAGASKIGLIRVAGAVIGRTHALFLLAMAVLLGSLVLTLGEKGDLLRRIVVGLALVQGGLWLSAALYAGLGHWRERRGGNGSVASAVLAVGFLGSIAIWALVFLLALDNFGVKVTALLAGLGVGGVAVALAVQNILGDLFASVSIMLDKPFEIGDFIVVGDMMGSVEYIGMKTTRVRSLSGEQIVFSNGDLLSSRIRNYKRMRERRIEFQLGVAYGTPHEMLARIPSIIREILSAQAKVRIDRVHCKKLDEWQIVYEAVYFVEDPDFTLYMDIQQAVNLALIRRFGEEGIEFPFPTRTIRLERTPRPEPADLQRS